MNILFIIIGPVSFNTASFSRNFIKQLDLQEHNVVLMSENFTYSYFEAKKNIKFFSMSEKFNEKIWKGFIEENKFNLIIIANVDLLFFENPNIIFKKIFLGYIKTKTLFLTTNSALTYEDDCIMLNSDPNTKLKLYFPFGFLKPCPPHIPDFDNEDDSKNFYWKNLEQFAFLGKNESRESILKTFKANEKDKIVFLLFDLQQVILASTQNLLYHYKIVIELVHKYLENLNINCHLAIGNIADVPININKESKVKVHFMGPLLDQTHETTMRASDLIITESIANTSLIDAANLKIPTINIKSTLMIEEVKDEDGNNVLDILYNFENITDFVNEKIQDLLVNCPNSIYPYLSFPNPASVNFEETKVFGHYIFTFTEIFDEENTTKIFKDFLINEETIKEEKYRIEQFLALRNESLEAEEILDLITRKIQK